ncbi:MAG: nuclear transport factor 2 family protein [Gammaproteobacteria bacterium]|jgi:hypothetical protein|nr:nuclear transport factor 2 family protein [Gammaproteobacteria bacterium]MBT3867595.1 nuclear transport factor 2 family protein [Gammaproteobacteria bacterium]MBT4381267.1 nuclear transport factor 2 family protein [Gammaproteobacteria bacterium]MBT4616842.1 nuclear transport factor 2 family protein [Gammaproteobacteria bacterium]MBT5196062.1 nuclear transport factor 2 family protein [Gammaproteobacteria bacterium]
MAKVGNVEGLLAEQAVRKAVTCYSRGADRCDSGMMMSAFHKDAEVRYGSFDGHYLEFCESVISGNLAMSYTTHTVMNEYYDIDAESGSGVGEVYVLAFFSVGEDEYLVAGRYIDKYECRNGDWRISYRQYVIDWSRTAVYSGDDRNDLFEGLIYKGTQNRNDLSYSILGDQIDPEIHSN